MQNYYEQYNFKDVPNVIVILPFVGTIGNLIIVITFLSKKINLCSFLFYIFFLFLSNEASVSLNLFGPLAQIITSQFGPHVTLILGTFLKAIGLIIAAWGKLPWQLIICQGIIFGIGTSFTYVVIFY